MAVSSCLRGAHRSSSGTEINAHTSIALTSVEASPAGPKPRAVGVRQTFAQIPPAVHAWVVNRFGPIEGVVDHVGGMSPGCAASLRIGPGRAAGVFVKAVGVSLNAQSVELFRAEARLLAALPAVPYRARLLDVYDDGEWVALALEDVPGRFPDMADDDDVAAIEHAIRLQMAELTPPPPGADVRPLAEDQSRWGPRWDDIAQDPARFLPPWAVPHQGMLCERARLGWTDLPPDGLCHWDVRDDNILIRPDGSAVLIDWGMARLGPAWLDLLLLAVQAPTASRADDLLRRWLPPEVQDAATNLILCLAGSQAWGTYAPPRRGIPTMGAFVAEDSRRLFAIARVRLGLG